MKVTKTYIIEHSSLEEADFENIDFDDFVDYFDLTPERLEEYDPSMVLALYKNAKSREPVADYTMIYAAAKGRIEEKDLRSVETIIWEYHSGNYNDCMIIDYKNNSVYYDLGFFLNACGESKKVSDFSKEDAVFVEKTLRECGITAWKNEYKGTSEGTTGCFGWAVGIRLNGGSCFRYNGEGVLNSGSPDTLRPMMKALITRFAEKKD